MIDKVYSLEYCHDQTYFVLYDEYTIISDQDKIYCAVRGVKVYSCLAPNLINLIMLPATLTKDTRDQHFEFNRIAFILYFSSK